MLKRSGLPEATRQQLSIESMTSPIIRALVLCIASIFVLDVPAAMLRMSGSNTVGADLGPALAVAWLESKGYDSILLDRKAGGAGILARNPSGESMEILIEARGSSSGFQDLSKGDADLAMSSRRVKDKEVNALAAHGSLTSLESEYIIALDGIAVIVHKDNPVSKLSKSQIRDIFLGKIEDWKEVGGAPGTIALYARDGKSGTFDVFKALVLGKEDNLAKGAIRFESNAELSDRVSANQNAIGFVGLPYIRDAKAVAIADGESPAILPNDFTVATEDFVLSRRLYLYLPGKSTSPLAREFAEYIVSPAAQEVVRKRGFVSQQIFAHALIPGDHYPGEIAELTKGSKRLSINIRFEADGISLDNKAKRDLDRVYEMLHGKGKQRMALLLFGFTAETGAPKLMNIERSTRVTRLAGRYLMDRGIWIIKSRGYGAVAAVASNDTEFGRKKNRRVEIWVQNLGLK